MRRTLIRLVVIVAGVLGYAFIALVVIGAGALVYESYKKQVRQDVPIKDSNQNFAQEKKIKAIAAEIEIERAELEATTQPADTIRLSRRLAGLADAARKESESIGDVRLAEAFASLAKAMRLSEEAARSVQNTKDGERALAEFERYVARNRAATGGTRPSTVPSATR